MDIYFGIMCVLLIGMIVNSFLSIKDGKYVWVTIGLAMASFITLFIRGLVKHAPIDVVLAVLFTIGTMVHYFWRSSRTS